MSAPRNLLDKIWDAHVVQSEPGCPAVLYVDLHLIHEVTSPQAFAELDRRGLAVRRPDLTLATMDHSTPTVSRSPRGLAPEARRQLRRLEANCARHGIELMRHGDPGNGIVHVIAPQRRLVRPGMTVVCGDSHTSTHGAFAALAFGIGSSEVAHVLGTQCLLQRKPASIEVTFEGAPGPAVTAKDLALAMIGRLTPRGGTGAVLEHRGECVRTLSMEGRMTLCNMSIEAGARAGLVAADECTAEWFDDDSDFSHWRSDPGAPFDARVSVDVTGLAPQVTWGTHPGMVAPVDGSVPEPADAAEARALAYMGLRAGTPLRDIAVGHVFIGSCTNGRIEDLRAAARVLRGRRVAPGVRMLVVPGSQLVKRQAEAEGLDRLFRQAGAQWREPGCSMCIAMNGDVVPPGEYCVSTSNRNFEGRQGPGARTLLASPLTAAASAVVGRVADPRQFVATAEVTHAI
ncbi:MAG: 3-isopropylmalate dehydratase large subunit [Planctomycetes bacterium]|nr:3-isopropylmalate dehydratase large subunit [Planctomycetota bacterium]MCW8136742.1 3-isopropylmalate dehydratase large subunit [Planctomycetota bacterium]